MCDQTITHSAHSPYSVCSDNRVECHAASGYRHNSFSGSPAANGISPRARQRDMILSYWESEGIARYVTGGAGGGGHWEARDILHSGAWMPLAGQGQETSAAHIVFSHVVSADNGGAFCACNLLPENGRANDNRGADDMTELNGDAVYVLTGWRGYALAVTIRPASLKRLTA